jgi:exonuclease III
MLSTYKIEVNTSNLQTLTINKPANIYAPLRYNNEKKEFFNNKLDVIANNDGENVILGGDFNITLTDKDSLRRQRYEAEKELQKTSSQE